MQNLALDKVDFEKKIRNAVKEAQHSQNELVQVRAQANTIAVELQDLKSRFSDLGGPNVYSEKQAEGALERSLQEDRDELAEMKSTLWGCTAIPQGGE